MKLVLFLLALVGLCHGEEAILLFRSEIKVNEDGWLDVTEKIRVRAEGYQIRRGIFRDFPQVYQVKWGFKEKRPFKVQGVRRNGEVEEFKTIRKSHGTRLRIGSEDTILPRGSIQEYEINYRTNFQLITNKDGVDQLYWNVTGYEWGFPIEKVEVHVELPDGIEVEKSFVWTGELGSTESSADGSFDGGVANFESLRVLSSGEGMTIAVLWPTGLLGPEAYAGPGLFASNPALILGMGFVVAGLLFYVVMWFRVGRDPAKGVIVPRWEPPEGFTPGGVRYLRNLAFDERCFSAGILGLAAEGKVLIREEDGEHVVVKKEGPPPFHSASNALFNRIFQYHDEVGLAPRNHVIIEEARNEFAQALASRIDRSFFLANLTFWLPGLIFGIVGVIVMLFSSYQGGKIALNLAFMLFVGFTTFSTVSSTILAIRTRGWAGLKSAFPGAWIATIFWVIAFALFTYNAGAWVGVFLLVVFGSGIVFHHLIKKPTKKGRRAMDEIEGFREYLKVAEEDRLNLENPPVKTPELFEKFLPYALALDVEQEWSEKFDEVLKAAGKAAGKSNYQPTYYTGNFSSTSQAFTGVAIGGALTSALTTASSAPTSSVGGSSGGGYSGGGGFSGGGGGGGGGGGW